MKAIAILLLALSTAQQVEVTKTSCDHLMCCRIPSLILEQSGSSPSATMVTLVSYSSRHRTSFFLLLPKFARNSTTSRDTLVSH
jgi:hypothetical protein